MKLKCDKLVSKFAFTFNFYRYSAVYDRQQQGPVAALAGAVALLAGGVRRHPGSRGAKTKTLAETKTQVAETKKLMANKEVLNRIEPQLETLSERHV